MDNVQHLAVGNAFYSSNAQENIPEWRKSRWCVSKEYDRMIMEAVNKGCESYNDLPEDLKQDLAREIIKTERNALFVDYDDSQTITEHLIQIMLSKHSPDSVEDLCDYLINYFMCNEHFIRNINFW